MSANFCSQILLICYQSQLGPNSNKNYKFNKLYELTKKTIGDGFCEPCIKNGQCQKSEGIEWRGIRIFYKGKREKKIVQIQADIFKHGEKLELYYPINPNEFLTFLAGHDDEINKKLIKADDISFAYFKQTKMHKSILYPLLDDYPGVFALKLDINVKTIKTNSNPTKYILAKLNDKNCQFNNTKT
uniref:Uncharacterized protein n=1 Tax=Meloidogyne incognita TaxID=6306 RepID=A0A914MBV2_MELIC